MTRSRPIAVYYEHPHWFAPLFDALARRGLPHVPIDAGSHAFDPSLPLSWEGEVPLFFNRMSPSAWTRGHGHAIFYTLSLLKHLESIGAPVFNGWRAFAYETSKALQVSLLERLGISVPKTRVVNDASALPAAARELEFPLVVKPNVGGSGAGIVRFDRSDELAAAVADGAIPRGLDGTLLLQEYHPPRGRSIARLETLEGRFLYGIRIHLAEDAGYDLCPADVCKTVEGETLTSAACPAGAEKSGLSVEAFDPPSEAIRTVERIAAAIHLDVGGIEYLDSERDERRYFYDVNALSNFVAEPVRVVGFDPTERLVDALEARAATVDPIALASGGLS